MRIRIKLLILLLVISLGPLLVVRTSVRSSLMSMGDVLAGRSSDTLAHKASASLNRIVSDHARLLFRERQLLESQAMFLASKVEGVLFGHSHRAQHTVFTPPPSRTEEMREEYTRLHMGTKVPFAVEFDSVTLDSATRERGPTGRNSMASRLTSPLQLVGPVKFELGNLALWIRVRFVDGTSVSYPATSVTGGMGMMSHMQMMKDDRGFRDVLHWAKPEVDSDSGRVVTRVFAPVRDTTGDVMGEVSIVVPIESLLRGRSDQTLFSDRVESYLVLPRLDPGTNTDQLVVLARERADDTMHGYWKEQNEDYVLHSRDEAGLKDISLAIRQGRAGVAGLRHDREEAIWAYAPIGSTGTALLVIVPREDVVREAHDARMYVLDQVQSVTSRLGVIILAVAVTAALIAMLLSKLFTNGITELASAVAAVAKGNLNVRTKIRSRDEVGLLAHSFNQMVPALRERIAMKNALEVAQEIQQNLLPSRTPTLAGYDLFATSIYCDETGGDYYDFMHRPNGGLVVAVGDVSGHGIPAALMMSSARAYLRAAVALNLPLDEALAEANRQFCQDVDQTGNFMTLFLIELLPGGRVRWVRAGHDPALLYLPDEDRFEELSGEGLPMGVTPDSTWSLGQRDNLPRNSILFIGTDGIWEATNAEGDMFGKEQLLQTIRTHKEGSMHGLVVRIKEILSRHCGQEPSKDDRTLAAIRVEATSQDEKPLEK